METEAVLDLVRRLATVDAASADRVALEAAIGLSRRLKSWVESRELALARSLTNVSSFPEKSLADASRSNLRQADQVIHRAETADQVPEFGLSLEAGRVTGDHVDVLGRALRQLDAPQREALVGEAERLVFIAEHLPPDEFARRLRREVRRLEQDGDADARFERQRRAVRLRSWVDRDTGMSHWAAMWDPQSALLLENGLDAQVEAMFHETQPDGCPADPLEKQSYLRALALLALFNGKGVRLGRPEIVVVVDHTHPLADGRPVVDWGLPVELPARVLADLAARSAVHTVVVRNGTLIDAPGELDLGRTTRLANRAQRRAMGALYPTCAIPGCHVRYSRTKLHHVIWWRHGGRTDFANLLPVCAHHHAKIHNDGWVVSITPERVLTIRFPDGSVMTNGPPQRGAA